MQRTITVKGTGTAKAAPDLIRIVLSLESKDFDYGFAMRFAERKIDSLKEALATVGFDRKALKTLNYDVRTGYSMVISVPTV